MNDGDAAGMRAALVWGAGMGGAAPDFDALDWTALPALARAHNIEARLAEVLRRCPHAPPELTELLNRRRSQSELELDDHVHRAGELVETLLRRHGIEVVVLKGATAFALLDEASSARWIADLDLIAKDPLELTEALLKEGYREHGERERVHTFSELERDGFEVDVHAWFPVATHAPYEPDDVVPTRNPGLWIHQAHLSTHRVDYESIRRESRFGVAPGTTDVRVARPELAALLASAQMHRDYVISVFPAPRATCRLNDLATLVELSRRPGFDHDHFRTLVKRHRGEAAVDFVAWLAEELTDDGAFLRSGTKRPTGWSTLRDLWWDGQDGFLVDLGANPDQLVLRSTTMTELIATLDGTIVSGFRDYGVGSWEAGGDAVQAIERVVLRSARGSAFPVRVRFEPDPSGLVVETKSPATPPGHMTALSFNFGDQRYELFHPHGHAWELHSYCNDGSGADAVEVHSTNGSEHSARVRFPPTAVTPPGPDRTVPLLLGIRCQRQGWGRSPAEVMLPVHIGS